MIGNFNVVIRRFKLQKYISIGKVLHNEIFYTLALLFICTLTHPKPYNKNININSYNM